MPDFGIEIDGDRLVALRFEQFPDRARVAIERRIRGLSQQLLARVHAAEPQRTGKLRGETSGFVRSSQDRITGGVHVSAPDGGEHGKAAALEYGAHGAAMVSAHGAQLSHVYNQMIQPMEVMVAAYDRRVNIAERRYLRGPLDDMRSQVVEELRQALAEAAAEG